MWEDWDSWITPNEKFFSIAHFDRPVIDAATWKLEIDGLVGRPLSLSLDHYQRYHSREWWRPNRGFTKSGSSIVALWTFTDLNALDTTEGLPSVAFHATHEPPLGCCQEFNISYHRPEPLFCFSWSE